MREAVRHELDAMNAMGDMDGLDAMIEAALTSEPMLAVPSTLHRRVCERVRFADLREKQSVRFRYTMGMLAASVLAMFGITGVVLWFSSPGVLGSQGVSGGMGHYDYFMAYFSQSWSGYSGAYSLLTAMALAGGTLVVGLIPLWRFASRKHV